MDRKDKKHTKTHAMSLKKERKYKSENKNSERKNIPKTQIMLFSRNPKMRPEGKCVAKQKTCIKRPKKTQRKN